MAINSLSNNSYSSLANSNRCARLRQRESAAKASPIAVLRQPSLTDGSPELFGKLNLTLEGIKSLISRYLKPATQPVSNPAVKTAPQATSQNTYAVGSSDTLWGIARKTLGDGSRWREIYEINQDQIRDPNVVVPGMKLKLPGSATATQPAAQIPSTYTVGSNDTLSGIARKTLGNGNRWREIYELNQDQIRDPNVIVPGMVLKLPGSSAPATRPATGINTNRSSFYIQQPNGWTCGPTSLTMALAAWGVRSANNSTVDEMVSLTGTNSSDGVPGNASVLSSAARKVGMQAQFVEDASPSNIRAALNRGHGVVLNGSISGGGGHFIYVAGIQSDGRFIIADPARAEITSMSDSELNHFANGYSCNPRGFAEIWK